MPYKERICGIYSITTPNGSQYVGSSVNVLHRWSEHRTVLRSGKHHSSRLQAAWEKYGKLLAFSILQTCERDQLNVLEQKWIDRLRPVLNTTSFVNNVQANPETRAKLAKHYSSEAWKRQRAEIGRRPRPSWVAVDCSNGTSYPNMARAAEAFNIRISGIKHLAKTQRVGRLGVRFKFAGEHWRDVLSSPEQRMATRMENGTVSFSEEARAAMRIKRRHWRVPARAIARASELNRTPVIAFDVEGRELYRFASIKDAAQSVAPSSSSAQAQICKACAGVKKTAYGFRWAKSKQKQEVSVAAEA